MPNSIKSIFQYLAGQTHRSSFEAPDPRTKDWFLISSEAYPVFICCVYLLFALHFGPKWFFQRGRVRRQLTMTLLAYNVFILVANIVMTALFIRSEIKLSYSLFCQPVVSNMDDAEDLNVARNMWRFHFFKVVELFDTVFIILKGKIRRLTLVHIYHHASVLLLTWVAVRYIPGGTSAVLATINSSSHIILYFYYKLTSMGYNPGLSFKTFVTGQQIIQFGLMTFICLTSVKMDCGFPKTASIVLFVYIITFFGLFIGILQQIRPAHVRINDQVDVQDE